jgi:hypothetical protein
MLISNLTGKTYYTKSFDPLDCSTKNVIYDKLGVSRRISHGTHISFATLFRVVAKENLVNPGDILAGILS